MKITFGKYKNQELEKVYNDTNYKKWLLKQHFFKNKYQDQYKILKNYKRPINFTDLPCDIKSMIYAINYNRDPKKLQHDYDKENGIIKNGKKGRKQIIKRRCLPWMEEDEYVRYINCANCGNALLRNGGGCYDQQHYECCWRCYEQFKLDAKKRREQKKQLEFCLISDSEDED